MGAGQPKPIKPSNEFVSAPTNINRPTGEINVKEEHNNYPAFISFNGDENYDEARFSIWTIVAAIGATLFLIYIIKRIWDCRRKSIAKKEEKAAKKEEKAKDAEKARDSRLEALAMTPIKWNNDRFEEITEKINQVQKIVEVIPSAGSKALTGSPMKSLLKCSHSPCAGSQILWLCPVQYLQNWGSQPTSCQATQISF